jgi:hypothetical protein
MRFFKRSRHTHTTRIETVKPDVVQDSRKQQSEESLTRILPSGALVAAGLDLRHMRATRTAMTTAAATIIPVMAAGFLHKRLLLASGSIWGAATALGGDATALGGDTAALGGDADAVGPGIGFLTAAGTAAIEALSTRACTLQVLNHRP